MKIFGKEIPYQYSILIWMGVWEIVGRLDLIWILPPISKVFQTIAVIGQTRTFWSDILLSLRTFGMGLGLAVIIGAILGIMMGVSRKVDDVLSIWVNLFISAPLTALVPIIMAIFGIGTATVVITVFLFALWPMMLDSRAGVQNVEDSLIEMANVYGSSRLQLYTKVILWAALPEMLTGLRVAIIRAVRGMVVGQLILSLMGLGRLFLDYSQHFLMERFFALLILVLAFAWALSGSVSYLEEKVEHFAKTR